MFDDRSNVSRLVLDVVLSQVYYGERGRVLQVGCLQQWKDLEPVTALQCVFIHFFDELYDHTCVFHLWVDGSRDWLSFVGHNLGLLPLVIQKLGNFRDSFKDNL